MPVLRLEPATLYPHERGSVLVPLPLLALPVEVETSGGRWRRKREMHVTAASTGALARRLREARGLPAGEAEQAAWGALERVARECRMGPVALEDDLRVIRRGTERTIVAMAEVEGLTELHDRIATLTGIPAMPPPAHVTLYTRPKGEGIGLHTAEDLERLGEPLGASPFPWPPSATG